MHKKGEKEKNMFKVCVFSWLWIFSLTLVVLGDKRCRFFARPMNLFGTGRRCLQRHAICLHLGVFLWGYEFEAIKAHIRMAISALSLFWGCQLMGRKHEVNNSDLWLSLSQCYRPVHKSGARAHETIRYHKESKNVPKKSQESQA